MLFKCEYEKQERAVLPAVGLCGPCPRVMCRSMGLFDSTSHQRAVAEVQ